MPASVKRKALSLLNGEQADNAMTEQSLQQGRALRENSLFELLGTVPELGPLDDHEVHLDEHRKYALGTSFEWISARDSALAEAFLAHIAGHEEARHA